MPQHNYYVFGEWNACCDQCGRVFKSGLMLKRWDNAMVCKSCWEPRHPQDFVKAIPDNMSVPWARPWIPSFETGLESGSPLGVPYLGETFLGN